MRLFILTVSLWALACAKPEMYREKEDFQFSRSSSDDGTKQGYYGAQRGNMGGNYEKAHNMDSLAQHQMSTLVRQVDGELGDGANTKTGSVYTAGNSRGIFGSGHYDLSNLKGRNFGEGLSYGDSQIYNGEQSSASNARYSESQLRALGYNSAFQSSGLASQQASHFDNQQVEGQYGGSSNTEYGANRATNYKYYSHGGSQARSEYDQRNTNAYGLNNYDAGTTRSRLVSNVPVRLYVRPGTRVTIPVAAQTYDASQSSLIQDQSVANSEAELLSNSGQRINVLKPTNNAKHYESSYSYRKEWEKHDSQPVTVMPTQNPFPKNSELYDDAQSSQAINENYQDNLASINSQSSSRNSAYAGHSSSHSSNTKVAAANQLQYHSQVQDSGNSALSNAYNIGLHSTDASSNLNNLLENSESRPKSYHSAYSYHKSWERRGDPYVIQPIADVSGAQKSQRLIQSASANKNLFSSNSYGSHYRQVGQSHDDCDDSEIRRRRRSYNINEGQNAEDNFYQHPNYFVPDNSDVLSQQFDRILHNKRNSRQQSQNKWDYTESLDQQPTGLEDFGQHSQGQFDNVEDLGQQVQNKWDNIESFNQQSQSGLEDLNQHTQGQDTLENLGQQTQNQWGKLEDLGQHTQSQIGNIEDLGQKEQHKWDTIESFNQHTQVGVEDLNQHTQNQDNLENLGQQIQNQWGTFEDLGQQTQNTFDNLGQQIQTESGKLENQGQETQNKWDNLENLGQQTQTHWDKLDQFSPQDSQQTQNTWKDIEDVKISNVEQHENNGKIEQFEQKNDNFDELNYNTQQNSNFNQYMQNNHNNFMNIEQSHKWHEHSESGDFHPEILNPWDNLFKETTPNQPNKPLKSNSEQDIWDKIDKIVSQSDKKVENTENWKETGKINNNDQHEYFDKFDKTNTNKKENGLNEFYTYIESGVSDHKIKENKSTQNDKKDILTTHHVRPSDVGRGDIEPDEVPSLSIESLEHKEFENSSNKLNETIKANKTQNDTKESKLLSQTTEKIYEKNEPMIIDVIGLDQQPILMTLPYKPTSTFSSNSDSEKTNYFISASNNNMRHKTEEINHMKDQKDSNIEQHNIEQNYDFSSHLGQIPEEALTNFGQQEQTFTDFGQQEQSLTEFGQQEQSLTDFGQQQVYSQQPHSSFDSSLSHFHKNERIQGQHHHSESFYFNQKRQNDFESLQSHQINQDSLLPQIQKIEQAPVAYLKPLYSREELSAYNSESIQKQVPYTDQNQKPVYVEEKSEHNFENLDTVSRPHNITQESIEPTEKPSFWKSLGGKIVNAKDKVVSWFKS